MDEYFEGEECPFCEAEYDDFFMHSEGLGTHSEVKHFYYCENCGKEWVNCDNTTTKEVK